MAYIIYRATNSLNGKSYIGYTGRPMATRRIEHEREVRRSRNKKSKFYRALKKYMELFIWEELDKCESHEEAQRLETYYISKYDTYQNGYNSTFGGDGIQGCTPEIKERIVKSLKAYHSQKNTRIKHSKERGGIRVYVFGISGDFVDSFDTQ